MCKLAHLELAELVNSAELSGLCSMVWRSLTSVRTLEEFGGHSWASIEWLWMHCEIIGSMARISNAR